MNYEPFTRIENQVIYVPIRPYIYVPIRHTSTTVENPLQIDLFMQNKPNFRKATMNANIFVTMNYKNFIPLAGQKNKPNQTQFKAKTNPISEIPKMNLNLYSTKSYGSFRLYGRQKTNPKQTQFKPNLVRRRRIAQNELKIAC